ncbi:hypothetical protein QBC39DRAFT_361533 [Podospora conica]|nr:hypothetical protein QBC39DRAFT_361533 [Schizothecium conicum]
MNLDTTNPTHDQVWDDSALVDSWNEALAEYQKYHSIHAKGGAVEDLLDPEQQTKTTASSDNAKPETSEPIAAASETAPHDANKTQPGVAPPKPMGGRGMPPQVLLGSVQDEGLKRLMMSWYYAGYYTGLYEGKQQAGQQQQTK